MNVKLCALVICALASAVLGNTCPDGSSCDDNYTCCPIGGTQYGCCPLPNAVCCDDDEHCCPEGYSCSEGLCFKAETSFRLKEASGNVTLVCPGGQYTCPDSSTCCPAGDAYSCCPLAEATCCSDGQHCCPGGTTCDLAHGTCNVPLSAIARHQSTKRAQVIVCPGGEYQCPDGNTCCLLETGEYGCCPLPSAVCCSDKIHCCPSGYSCDGARCIQAVTSTPEIALVALVKMQLPEDQSDFILCPDGTSKCPDGQTCCTLSTGEFACCPMDHAVCCEDHIHCCPEGSQCDVAHSRCSAGQINQTLSVVPWVEKVPALPRHLQEEDESSSNDIGTE